MKKSLLTLALAGLLVAPTVVFAADITETSKQVFVNTDEEISDEELAKLQAQHDKEVDANTVTEEEEWVENPVNDNPNAIDVKFQGKEEPMPGAQGSTAKPEEKKAAETKASEDKKAEGAKAVKAAATKTAAKALPKTSAAK
ncbi:hypothetical protein ACVRYP_04050 [Streptococcus rifensis]